MYDVSRRNALKTIFGATGLVAASTRAKAFGSGPAPTTTGTLNLHFRGPFAYLFFQNLKKVLVLAPTAPFHHLPEISWESNELPLQKKDYELCGFTSSSSAVNDPPRPYPFGGSAPNRLNVPWKQLDQTASDKLVDAEGRRLFSLRVPVPDLVVPGHLAQVHLQGHHAPAGPNLYPVGHTFIYTDVPLSDVALLTNNCTTNCAAASCTLGLVPLPGQTHADVSVQMDPSEDEDPNHSFGAEAFDACRDLFRSVKLDLQLCYNATCLPLPKTESMRMQNTQIAPQDANFRGISFPFTHTGADCHAPVIEITGTRDDLTLGSRS